MNAPRIASRIAGTGHYVPERVLSNFDLEKRVDTTDKWIVERTGIRERRIAADGENTSDMATAAARRALEAAELVILHAAHACGSLCSAWAVTQKSNTALWQTQYRSACCLMNCARSLGWMK